MAEFWDIYDINKNKIGKIAERNVYQFKKGEYHIVVTGIIMNAKNEILISKRAEHKKFVLMWECSGGSILTGEAIDTKWVTIDEFIRMYTNKEIVPTVDFGKAIYDFEGKCIAVIHRTNDNDDKLIVVPEGKNYTDEEIRMLTNFQEQYFESEIIR